MDELEEIRRKKLEALMSKTQKVNSLEMPSEPIQITDGNFDEFVKRYDTVVVDCWAPWCGPCRMIAPVIDALARDLQGRIVFGKLNTDENQMTAVKYRIQAIPTLLVFHKGHLADRIVGAMPKDQILKKLQKYI